MLTNLNPEEVALPMTISQSTFTRLDHCTNIGQLNETYVHHLKSAYAPFKHMLQNWVICEIFTFCCGSHSDGSWNA
jgi:hypothetical protein